MRSILLAGLLAGAAMLSAPQPAAAQIVAVSAEDQAAVREAVSQLDAEMARLAESLGVEAPPLAPLMKNLTTTLFHGLPDDDDFSFVIAAITAKFDVGKRTGDAVWELRKDEWIVGDFETTFRSVIAVIQSDAEDFAWARHRRVQSRSIEPSIGSVLPESILQAREIVALVDEVHWVRTQGAVADPVDVEDCPVGDECSSASDVCE